MQHDGTVVSAVASEQEGFKSAGWGRTAAAFVCRACVSSLCVLWLRSKDMQWVQLTASSKLAVDMNVRVNLSLC